MIEEFDLKSNVNHVVLRLAGLPVASLDVVMMRRGIRPESLAETRAVLELSAVPFTPEKMIDETFAPKAGFPTSFPIGRYGNGQWAVYYSALFEGTCVAEITYHLRNSDLDGRYYTVVSCQFDGAVRDLLGKENVHPELVSEDDSGYPYCQSLAAQLRSQVSGLLAPSARQQGGVCIPVLDRSSLSKAQILHRGKFNRDAGGVRFQVI